MAVRFIAVLSVLLLVFAPPVVAQTPHTHQHSFGDADKWAKVFDDPARARGASMPWTSNRIW
ncbi:MAG: hypothetical protein NT115_05075 [Proteobacteria bacterium]|nr:hypothetical protein [Pseudomonadota bacterium]